MDMDSKGPVKNYYVQLNIHMNVHSLKSFLWFTGCQWRNYRHSGYYKYPAPFPVILFSCPCPSRILHIPRPLSSHIVSLSMSRTGKQYDSPRLNCSHNVPLPMSYPHTKLKYFFLQNSKRFQLWLNCKCGLIGIMVLFDKHKLYNEDKRKSCKKYNKGFGGLRGREGKDIHLLLLPTDPEAAPVSESVRHCQL